MGARHIYRFIYNFLALQYIRYRMYKNGCIVKFRRRIKHFSKRDCFLKILKNYCLASGKADEAIK